MFPQELANCQFIVRNILYRFDQDLFEKPRRDNLDIKNLIQFKQLLSICLQKNNVLLLLMIQDTDLFNAKKLSSTI